MRSIPLFSCTVLRQTACKLHKKAASTVTGTKQLFKCSHNWAIVLLLLLGQLLKLMLVLLLMSSLKVAKAARAVKEKTEGAVWSEVSWEMV